MIPLTRKEIAALELGRLEGDGEVVTAIVAIPWAYIGLLPRSFSPENSPVFLF